MRQRVALARTLAIDPSVLLLDEPFSAVDAQTRMVLQRELAQTLKREGKTALLITHDLLEAVTLSDRVLVMSRRPGRIIDEIRIDLPRRDDPIARRQEPRVNDYVGRLMDRLDIGHARGGGSLGVNGAANSTPGAQGNGAQPGRAGRVPGGVAVGAGPARHSPVHHPAAVHGVPTNSCACWR